MRVLILSPFKTGTSTLLVSFINNNIETVKLHDFNETLSVDYTHVFVVSRNPHDLYISAFFQDIDNPEFEYHYGTKEQILNATTDELISHFNNINWERYNHLNINYFLQLIKTYFNVDLKRNHDEKYKIVKFNNTHFIYASLEYLSETFEEICKLVDLPDIKLENHNSFEYKWYNDIYKNFISKLKSV